MQATQLLMPEGDDQATSSQPLVRKSDRLAKAQSLQSDSALPLTTDFGNRKDALSARIDLVMNQEEKKRLKVKWNEGNYDYLEEHFKPPAKTDPIDVINDPRVPLYSKKYRSAAVQVAVRRPAYRDAYNR